MDFILNSTFGRLFLRKQFGLHRVVGLFYLLQWAAALVLYFADYELFTRSSLVWMLPVTGVAQTIIAMKTFTFLPKNKDDQGYYTSARVMSYAFVAENLFFSGLLCFQWFYYTDRLRESVVQRVPIIETVFVFFPYQFRFLFSKTSFRKSINDAKNLKDANRTFFVISTYITKIFYIWAKHFIGFFLNYVQFLGRVTRQEQYYVYLLLIFSCCATTISLFLQTLKFKGYMGPKTSFLLYMASYLSTFYSFFKIYDIFSNNLDLVLIAAGGVLANFSSKYVQTTYQVLVMCLLTSMRVGYLPSVLVAEYFEADFLQNYLQGAVLMSS